LFKAKIDKLGKKIMEQKSYANKPMNGTNLKSKTFFIYLAAILVATGFFAAIPQVFADSRSYILNYAAGLGGTLTGTIRQTVVQGASGSTVTAVPNTGYIFKKWSDGSTANPRTDTNVTKDVSAAADFTFNQSQTYTLNYAAGLGGTLTGTAPQAVVQGASGSPVTAVANNGYKFSGWSDGSTANPRTDANVNNFISVTANFTANSSCTLTYTAGTGGKIAGTNPQTVVRGLSGSPVTAMSDLGYVFVNWSDGLISNPRVDTNVIADVTVNAIFSVSLPFYNLSYSAATGGKIAGTASQTVAQGLSGSPVAAVPDLGYVFKYWSDGSAANPRTDANVAKDISATANFSSNPLPVYTLFYAAGVGGSITGTLKQAVGQGLDGTPVTAVPNSGYKFIGWSDGLTANPRTDSKITANVSVIADFAANSYHGSAGRPSRAAIMALIVQIQAQIALLQQQLAAMIK
jgi:hypothetical protein